MDDFNLDDENELDALKEKQSRGELMKGVLSGMGGMLQAQADVPSAYEYLYKKTGTPTDFQGSFDKMAGSIKDPMENAAKAQAYLKAKREGRAGERAERMAQDADDPMSGDADSYRKQLYALAPSLNGKLEGMTLQQMERTSPILMAKIRGEQDERMARIAAGEKNAARRDALADKEEQRKLKQQELSSTQAKQRGLYEMGKTAEQQFGAAVADKNEYDPTVSGQWIDNSSWAPNWMKNNKAIEAQNAQKSWIESYLRDASGAAIPESERQAYAEIYFPQPGDTPTVVANKEQLRAQKMDSARIAAGVGTGHGPADTPLQSKLPPSPKKTRQQIAMEELAKRDAAKRTAGR